MARFVANGQGKGWANGRTAATDARIARGAAAHRGMTYRRRISVEQDRRCRSKTELYSRRTLPLEWSNTMAYVVGLMATDGCLITGRKQLNFKSEDEQLVQTFLQCLGRASVYGRIRGRTGNVHYVAQFGDAAFYDWLTTIGLMPRKSLTLGAIDVPDTCLLPAMRGLFDGDGCIQNFVHRPTRRTYPDYEYERLWVYFTSASKPHVEWIHSRLGRVLGVTGYIEVREATSARHAFYRLKYGKHDSIVLLRAIYPNATVPKLERKWVIWDAYRQRNALS